MSLSWSYVCRFLTQHENGYKLENSNFVSIFFERRYTTRWFVEKDEMVND